MPVNSSEDFWLDSKPQWPRASPTPKEDPHDSSLVRKDMGVCGLGKSETITLPGQAHLDVR